MRRPRRKFGPSRKERIFLACFPDAEAATRIYALAERLKDTVGLMSALILPEHLHVTLFHLGDWNRLPAEILDRAGAAASQISLAPFEVVFDRARSFRNRTGVYPFVLTGEKHADRWQPLHDMLAASLTQMGLGGAARGAFEPHVTLAYDETRISPAPVDPPISWTVREVVLVHSELGKTTHHHLGRWALRHRDLANGNGSKR